MRLSWPQRTSALPSVLLNSPPSHCRPLTYQALCSALRLLQGAKESLSLTSWSLQAPKILKMHVPHSRAHAELPPSMPPINDEVACCCQSPWGAAMSPVPGCAESPGGPCPLPHPPAPPLLLPATPGPTSVPLAPAKGLELEDWG